MGKPFELIFELILHGDMKRRETETTNKRVVRDRGDMTPVMTTKDNLGSASKKNSDSAVSPALLIFPPKNLMLSLRP